MYHEFPLIFRVGRGTSHYRRGGIPAGVHTTCLLCCHLYEVPTRPKQSHGIVVIRVLANGKTHTWHCRHFRPRKWKNTHLALSSFASPQMEKHALGFVAICVLENGKTPTWLCRHLRPRKWKNTHLALSPFASSQMKEQTQTLPTKHLCSDAAGANRKIRRCEASQCDRPTNPKPAITRLP